MITESLRPEELVSSDVGLVHRLDAGMAPYDHPRLATAFAEVCDTTPLFGSRIVARAGGAADRRSAARRAALGEAVERYSAAHVPVSLLRTAPPSELAGIPVVEPEWLDRHAGHGSVRWAPGWRLHADRPGEPAWVAASRAYLSGPDDAAAVAVPTSTGLASHPNPWQALLAGLLEVIERDAVMTAWYHRRPGVPLSAPLRWSDGGAAELRFDRAVEEYRLVLLDSPVEVPVVLGLALGASGQPGAAVGAAADPDIARAARRALVEAQQTFTWGGHMLAAGQAGPDEAAAIDDLDQHVAYYLDPARRDAFAFLADRAATPRRIDLGTVARRPDPEQACRELISRIEAAGLEAFAVDVTAPDVRAAGIWVIRALIPALYPLVVGTRAPDHPRVPPALVAARDPHPFP